MSTPYDLIQRLCAEIEALDAQLVRLEDGNGWITDYQMKTGAWHRLLGAVRGGYLSLSVEKRQVDANWVYEAKSLEERDMWKQRGDEAFALAALFREQRNFYEDAFEDAQKGRESVRAYADILETVRDNLTTALGNLLAWAENIDAYDCNDEVIKDGYRAYEAGYSLCKHLMADGATTCPQCGRETLL